MLKMIFTIVVKPGTLPATLAAAKPCISATRREPGCLSYDFYSGIDGSDTLVTVECFKDKDAHRAHEKAPHFLAFLPTLRANVVSYTEETILTEGGPPTPRFV